MSRPRERLAEGAPAPTRAGTRPRARVGSRESVIGSVPSLPPQETPENLCYRPCVVLQIGRSVVLHGGSGVARDGRAECEGER